MSDPGDRPVASASREAAGRNDLVLVVDDDEAMRDSLVALLQLEGIPTAVAGRVDEALRAVASRNPAVVVLDYHLPDGSGIELATMIKDQDPETPVLLLTGFATLDTAVDAVGRLDAYLIKPVAPGMFLATVAKALASRRSVAEQRHLVEELERQSFDRARHDPLTGLPNRLELDQQLREGAALCQLSGRTMAVYLVGLDRFKHVNDVFGHEVGDEILREMSRRLNDTSTSSDAIARFGGDTFVIACPHTVDVAEAELTAARILEDIARPVTIAGVEHHMTASIGLVLAASSSSTQSILRDAEIAMFGAKEAGRGCYVLFEPAMRATALARFEVERGLRAALHDDALSVQYQPIVDAHSARIAGAEALLRWDRPEIGTMLPSSFLDVADESGLVVAMGAWALERALADLSTFASGSTVPEAFRVWVNVSPKQLAVPNFAKFVYDKLESYGVTPDLLGLEILEQALLDIGETERALRALRAMGVALHLDDFGAGHSNLWWLQELPITGIKIDRRFVATLDDGADPRNTTIAGGLVQLGHSLGLTVVAEGVETSAQATSVDALGCDLAQGYFYGFPGSAEQLWQLIAFEQAGSGEHNTSARQREGSRLSQVAALRRF